MSKRFDIMEAIIAACEGITIANGYNTDILFVSDILDLKHPKEIDPNKFPGLYPVDMDEEVEEFEVGIGSAAQILSNLQVVITCMVFDTYSETLLKRTNLIQDVNKAITQDADLGTLLLERATLTDVVTDKGFYGQTYSVWDQNFSMKYLFDEDLGG